MASMTLEEKVRYWKMVDGGKSLDDAAQVIMAEQAERVGREA